MTDDMREALIRDAKRLAKELSQYGRGFADGPGMFKEAADTLRSLAALSEPTHAREAVGEAGSMPGTSGFTMACFKADEVPIGTKLYASASDATARTSALLAGEREPQ